MDEFKPNSHRAREEEPERKKVEKVVTGKVKTKKKSSSQKIAELFISEDITSVKSHILDGVLIPALKDTLYDAVTSGLGMLLGGEGRNSGYRRGASTNSRESYSQYYKKDTRTSSGNRSTPIRTKGDRYNYDDVILDSRAEAEEVLDVLKDYLMEFGMVSLLELYESVGQPSNYMDSKYGWYDLNSATIAGSRSSGYWIKFPRITLLD